MKIIIINNKNFLNHQNIINNINNPNSTNIQNSTNSTNMQNSRNNRLYYFKKILKKYKIENKILLDYLLFLQ